MAVMVTVVLVVLLLFFIVFLFIVLSGLFPLHINAAVSFHIVWAVSFDIDVDPRRRREVATDMDIHTWRGRKARRGGKTGPGLTVAYGDGGRCH
jgi:hypothetical protein